MQEFKIEGTKKSPEIIFDSVKSIISIHGRSVMSNLDDDFYSPVFKTINNLIKEKVQSFTLEFKLDYFNTSSHLSIIKMFKSIDEIYSIGTDTKVIWAYSSDDIEMKEIGEEIQRFCKVKFNYKAID